MREDMNTITVNGKVVAHHYWTTGENWLIVWAKDLPKEQKKDYWLDISNKANELGLLVEFKDE